MILSVATDSEHFNYNTKL